MTHYRLLFNAPEATARSVYAHLEQLLEEEGIAHAIWEPEEDSGIFEVSIYLQAGTERLEEQIGKSLREAFPDLQLHREKLPDVDWVAKSLEGLTPVRAGRFLVHGHHDRSERRIGDLAVEIEAGQAFGTGHHGTTSGCLTMLTEVMRREQPLKALDLGTGSAVLAIAIAKLAPIAVLATDIDPVAVRVARENVALNGKAGAVRCVTARGFADPAITSGAPYDLIVANILARPLMALAPAMARHIAPGGSTILSGILIHQRRAVIAAYVGQGFRHIRTLTRGEWVTIHLKR